MKFQVEIVDIGPPPGRKVTSLAIYEVESASAGEARVDGLRIFRDTHRDKDRTMVVARSRPL